MAQGADRSGTAGEAIPPNGDACEEDYLSDAEDDDYEYDSDNPPNEATKKRLLGPEYWRLYCIKRGLPFD